MGAVSRVYSAELDGIDARLIEVETDVHVGLHSFTIVGLADKALSEAKERVNAALKNTGVKPPTRENRRIVVNLAPADVKKTGSQYDAAIAVGYLVATGQMGASDLRQTLIVGELSLEGKLRPVSGVLAIARLAHAHHMKACIVPAENAREAAIVHGLSVIPVQDLGELIAHLEGRAVLSPHPATALLSVYHDSGMSITDIKGQEGAKRALMIAAAGGHNVLMVGPPGTGKTMLAQALTSILPPLTPEETLEVTQIWSAAGLLGPRAFLEHRPFRAPHQTASPAAIVGGGSNPKPGEISLAHRGVLFLDEFPEFRRDILESLRQPLENGAIVVSRVRGNLRFPARFTLVAAMNPCPCGYYGDDERACRCNAFEVMRYQKRVSGPLLDRIDIQVTVPRVAIETLRTPGTGNDTLRAMREGVARARSLAQARLGATGRFTNAEMSAKDTDAFVELEPDAEAFVTAAFEKAFISPRGYYRILKVARTIADLAGRARVASEDVREAFGYRVRSADPI